MWREFKPITMPRTILVLIFTSLLVCTQSFGQTNHRNKIGWKADRPLTWDDFKVKSDNRSGMKAMTDSGIAIWFDCSNRDQPIAVKCFFDNRKSWTKAPDNESLLEHEQLHFDITELFTRKLRKKLAKLADPCGNDSHKVQGIYDRNFEEMNSYQRRYDKETEHSVDEKAQKEWEEKVERELLELNQFASK